MKDAQGHGSNADAGMAAAVYNQALSRSTSPAVHQTGVMSLPPSLAEGRELYTHLMAVAQARRREMSGFSKDDLAGWAGGTNQGGHYDTLD